MVMATALPDALSALIRAAVAGARGLDRDVYDPVSGRICHLRDEGRGATYINFAGAFAASALGWPSSRTLNIDVDASAEEADLIRALVFVERGDIGAAMRLMSEKGGGAFYRTLADERLIWRYEDEKRMGGGFAAWNAFDAFLRRAEALAAELEALGR